MALSIKVDRERCMGSGNCAFHAPNTFDLDDEFFERLHEHFTDAEILDLTICIATFVALGRTLNVLGIETTELTDVNYVKQA